MSRKYYDKVLSGSGTSSVKVKSAFGSKILAKYGWKEGQGLGSSMEGVEECVQVERREERVGIGAEKKSDSEWDNWWSGAYDSVASKIAVTVKSSKSAVSTSGTESSQASDDVRTEKKQKKKGKKEKRDPARVSDDETAERDLHKKRRVKRHVRDEPEHS
jgi:hypothetical protein